LVVVEPNLAGGFVGLWRDRIDLRRALRIRSLNAKLASCGVDTAIMPTSRSRIRCGS
jgi:hypothetical protein